MIKKVISTVDFEGRPYKAEARFHLGRNDLVELMVEFNGDFVGAIEQAVANQDSAKMVYLFTLLCEKSYGVLSADRRSFIKDPAKTLEFKGSTAFDSLLWDDLLASEDSAATFFNSLLPSDLVEAASMDINSEVTSMSDDTEPLDWSTDYVPGRSINKL